MKGSASTLRFLLVAIILGTSACAGGSSKTGADGPASNDYFYEGKSGCHPNGRLCVLKDEKGRGIVTIFETGYRIAVVAPDAALWKVMHNQSGYALFASSSDRVAVSIQLMENSHASDKEYMEALTERQKASGAECNLFPFLTGENEAWLLRIASDDIAALKKKGMVIDEKLKSQLGTTVHYYATKTQAKKRMLVHVSRQLRTNEPAELEKVFSAFANSGNFIKE